MRRRGQDGGSVMVVVLVLFIALSLTVLATVSYVSQGTKHSRHEQDVERANAAAASGLADLVSLLRADPEYLRQVTPAAKDKADGYCQNEAAGGPDGDVLAGVCGWGPTTPARWKPVDAAEGGSGEFYHYAVRRLPIDAERIDVEVTGKANGVYRTVKASVARESSSMWLYITNYELADPTDIISYASSRSIYESQGALTAPACGGGWTVDHTPPELGYAWQVGTGSPPKPPRIYRYGSVTLNWEYACTQPTFIDVDVLAGRIHSNDTVQSRGAQFKGEFSTALPECKQAEAGKPDTWSKCLSSGSWAGFGAMPQYRKPIELPSVTTPNSLSLNGQGCRYEGATRIIFNADGT
ncbi:MAG: hypothetical protein LBO20_07490, partial [Bifidobacteriaceae bacterium]|nr:hypothetical protein [Bifidobacteriaceae bacterium]